ncbi:hypothetical protein ACHQM5_002178 [Ranunculus cassubicifolius]
MGCDNNEEVSKPAPVVGDVNICKPVRQRQSVADLKFPLREKRYRHPKRDPTVLSGDKCYQKSVEFSGLSPDIDRNTINENLGPISTRTATTITILDQGEINKLCLHFSGYTEHLVHVATCEVEQALRVRDCARPRQISDQRTFIMRLQFTKKAKVDAPKETAVGGSESIEAGKDKSPCESRICPIIV